MLQPCPSCRRHVRDLERCPFCGSAPVQPRETIDLGLGRVSRAVVFASAALAASACGGTSHKAADEAGEPRRHAGGGGCVDPDQKQIDELEKKKAEAKTEEEKAAIDEQLREARMPQCMPYGAPPARRRIV